MKIFMTIFFLIGCASVDPSKKMSGEDPIKGCPDVPHCVSSLSTTGKRYIEPFYFDGSTESFQVRIKKAISNLPRFEIVEIHDKYIRVAFTTLLLRFTDDAEFFYDVPKKLIQIKSSSRVGYYDLGVNRDRMEKIREFFERNL